MQRDLHQRADRDIAAFLVVLGIMALMCRVTNAMFYAGQPIARQCVSLGAFLVLGAADFGWLCWRLGEYERIRDR